MISGLLITINRQGWELPAEGANRPASRMRRITPRGERPFLKERMLRRSESFSPRDSSSCPRGERPAGQVSLHLRTRSSHGRWLFVGAFFVHNRGYACRAMTLTRFSFREVSEAGYATKDRRGPGPMALSRMKAPSANPVFVDCFPDPLGVLAVEVEVRDSAAKSSLPAWLQRDRWQCSGKRARVVLALYRFESQCIPGTIRVHCYAS